MSVLGIPVHLVNLSNAVDRLLELTRDSRPHMIFVRDVASLMHSVDSPKLQCLHQKADLVVADGMPLVWIGGLRGHGAAIGRVAGADLVDAVCQASLGAGTRHFFFGGKAHVADLMVQRLKERYPDLAVAGTLSPPMRAINENYVFSAADLAELQTIRDTSPDVIWVGLSSPKQEYWMSLAAPLLGRGVCVGVGAAFDFHSGAIKRAPRWMQRAGFEWFYRFMQEPRRLWRRYLLLAPRFVFQVLAEQAVRSSERQRKRT